jgi:hypothetical protein
VLEMVRRLRRVGVGLRLIPDPQLLPAENDAGAREGMRRIASARLLGSAGQSARRANERCDLAPAGNRLSGVAAMLEGVCYPSARPVMVRRACGIGPSSSLPDATRSRRVAHKPSGLTL